MIFYSLHTSRVHLCALSNIATALQAVKGTKKKHPSTFLIWRPWYAHCVYPRLAVFLASVMVFFFFISCAVLQSGAPPVYTPLRAARIAHCVNLLIFRQLAWQVVNKSINHTKRWHKCPHYNKQVFSPILRKTIQGSMLVHCFVRFSSFPSNDMSCLQRRAAKQVVLPLFWRKKIDKIPLHLHCFVWS